MVAKRETDTKREKRGRERHRQETQRHTQKERREEERQGQIDTETDRKSQMDRQDPKWMEGLEEAKGRDPEPRRRWAWVGEGDRGVPWTPRSPTCPPLPLSVGKPHQSRAQVRNECPIPRGMQATKVSEPHQDCCVCSGKPPYLPWVICSCERTPPPPGPHKPGSQGCSTGASRGPLRCPPSWVHPGLRRLREL